MPFISYNVHSTKGYNITFYYNNNIDKTIEVNMKELFPEYVLLNPDPLKVNHFIDIKRKELVFIPDKNGHLPSLSRPTYGWISDNDGSLYRPATQMELDNYETQFPHSHNGKLYQYLIENFTEE